MLRDDKRRLGCYLMLALFAAVVAVFLVIQLEAGPKQPRNVPTQPVK